MESFKLVYICHPYSDDPEGNTLKVHNIVSNIYLKNERSLSQANSVQVIPISSFTLLPKSMCEPKISRDIAMGFCLKMLGVCDEIWMYAVDSNGLTPGMREEYLFSKAHKIRVVWKGFEN